MSLDTVETPASPGAGGSVHAQQVRVYEATGGWRALDFGEMWRFRDLFRSLVMRDVKLRYRQTLLGVGWVVLLPLLSAGVLTFVFGSVAKLPSNGVPYFLVTLAGMVAWTFFSGVLARGSSSLVNNAALVGKVFFPRALLPLSAIGSTTVDMLVSLVLATVLAATQGIYPTAAFLLAPVWLGLGILVVLGPTLIFAAATVSYRDVNYILPIFVQMLLYVSPVAYSLEAVPAKFRDVYALNPLVAPLQGLRHALLGYGDIPASSVLSSVVFASLFLFAGATYFSHQEQRFADVI